MKELQEILKKVSNFAPDEKAILATVVDVQGSGYRRSGARMLIDENGFSIGTVSGGCLEADVLERAKKVLETGEPCVITYDTTKDENSLFGLGMGCRGIVRVLLEPIQSDYFDFLKNCYETRDNGVVATLIERKGKPQPETKDWKVGSRMFVKSNYETTSNFKETGIWKDLYETCIDALKKKQSRVKFFNFGYWVVTSGDILTGDSEYLQNDNEFFIEVIQPPISLLLFGAGYDALPLIKFAKEIGWRVSVVDHRAAFANRERLPEADEITVSHAEDLAEDFFTDKNSVAVVMTHNYDRDREILPRLLRSNFLYIGALGPKTRTEKILNESGETFADEQLAKLYAPIGLDIGANSPEAIALSIIAEINAVLANRNGGFLRERQGSIYNRS